MLPEDLTYFLPPPHGREIYALFSTTPTLEGKAKDCRRMLRLCKQIMCLNIRFGGL